MSRRGRSIEWSRVLEVFLVLWVLPTVLFALVAIRWPSVLNVGYHVLAGLFVLQATMAYVSAVSALGRDRSPADGVSKRLPPVPKTTFIVSAYLPNEVDVIEATLLNLLEKVKRPAAGIEVILAYNSSHFIEDIETRLRALALARPELILANAHGSRSKSANLNYALKLASGEIIALFDADHLVAEDCLERAWVHLATGADVVQGRCKIRNGGETRLASMVEVEFEVIYGIAHHAKTLIFRTALFGGSDAYWRAEVLKSTGFSEELLTEDIDATLRALLAGRRFVHDRGIVSRELAPTTLGNLWVQRKRWAQGWFQCSRIHQGQVLRSRFLSARAKFLWTWLLVWREIYDVSANLLFPIVAAYWIHRGAIDFPMTPFIWFALGYTMLSGPFEGVVAFLVSSPPRLTPARCVQFALMAFPYTLFKSLVHMSALRDEMLGQRKWELSPRATVADGGKP